MKTTGNVSSELRKIEKEIDDYYKSNPLLKLPFATAASYLLRSAEEYMLSALLMILTFTKHPRIYLS